MKNIFTKNYLMFNLVFLLLLICTSIFITSKVQAANFGQVYMRYDRMTASVATNVLVVIKPASVGTEAKLKISFNAGTTVAASPTVDTTNLPAGVLPLPGTLTATGVGQTCTIGGVTDLTVGSTAIYGVNIRTGITNGTAGAKVDTVFTTTGADGVIDLTKVATRVVAVANGDQIVITANVPPSFDFSISGTSDAFTTDLSTGAVVSTTGKTVTLTTNAARGWIAWVKSTNAALSSVTSGQTIPTTGTVNGAPNTLSNGTNGYVLDADVTTQGGGAGTMTIDPEYNGTDAQSGGTLSTNYQPIATADGTTDGDIFTVIARATISALLGAASDYTDTLTIVGAGNF